MLRKTTIRIKRAFFTKKHVHKMDEICTKKTKKPSDAYEGLM